MMVKSILPAAVLCAGEAAFAVEFAVVRAIAMRQADSAGLLLQDSCRSPPL